jgi:flavin-dependent dehydrogenase
MHDLLVVGAGPAGAASSALLARRGYRVLLVDRAHFPRPKACAEYMSPGVMDVLRRTGLDGSLHGSWPLALQGMVIVSAGGARLPIRYERGGCAEPAWTLPRQELDARLVEHAVSCGVELMEGCVVRDPIVEKGAVRGVTASCGGTPIHLRAGLTIAADGARSTLASRLRLAAPARWPVRLGLVAHYEGEPELPAGFGEMHVSPGGYCGVAPLPGGRFNVAVVTDAGALQRTGLSATRFLERWIEEHLALRRLLHGSRRITPVRGFVPLGARSRAAGMPGLLLAGDAAGFFDPFTGEGIYRALRSAEIIDSLLAGTNTGSIGPEQASRYARMRHGAFRGKEAVTALVQIFVSRPALLDYALPRLASRSRAHSALAAVLGDIAPASEFLNARTLLAALRP